MDNHSKHKALYQLNRFMESDYFIECDLSAYEIAILYTIARYLDMPTAKCYAKQDFLAKKSGMKKRQFIYSVNILRKLKLITVFSSWRNNGYELGEYFEQQL